MPAIENPTLFARLRRTTMTELLRGRISSGHTPAMIIAASGLDASTKSLITDICKQTKLWNAERVDVARELVAHFADGKDAGVSSDKLIRAFGDPTQAAKLIRRGKIRNRSLLWHAKRFLLRTAGVLVVLYLGLAIYYSMGKPRVTVDYIAKLNASVNDVPENERAWPFYKQIALENPKVKESEHTYSSVYPDRNPRRWARVAEWLHQHDEILALADQATARPFLGYSYGPKGSSQDLYSKSRVDDSYYGSVISVLLPYLNDIRITSNLLAADAQLAAEERDAERWMRRIGQLRTVVNHAGDQKLLINSLVAIGIEQQRLSQIDALLAGQPELLSDEQLATVAHELCGYQKPSDLITYRIERYQFEDLVQRIFTDDGHGDGRMSARGVANLEQLTGTSQNGELTPLTRDGAVGLLNVAASPATALLFASRRELMDKYNSIMDRAEVRLHEPWREHANNPLFIETQQINSSFRDSIKYTLIRKMVPSVDRSAITAERLITRRDAVLIGIALELHRRRHGTYPATLTELAPQLLPAVPLDPCDGQPMRYKLIDGKPVVYSIGIDLDDDGGMSPVPKPEFLKSYSHRNSNGYELAIGKTNERYDGDWILYPEPPFPVDEDENQDQPESPTATTSPTE